MTLPIHSIKTDYSLQLVNNQKDDLLIEIDNIVDNFEKKSFSIETVITIVNLQLEKLLESEDISIIRNGLCSLLRLNIKDVQTQIIEKLSVYFHIKYLKFDLEEKQVANIVKIEKKIREIIDKHIRSNENDQMLPHLLHIYQDIWERLWLIPFLQNEYHIIDNDALITARNNLRLWINWLSKETKQENLIEEIKAIDSICHIQTIIDYLPPIFAENIKYLINSNISLVNIFNELANFYNSFKCYQRALHHYLKGLECIKDTAYEGSEIEEELCKKTEFIFRFLGKYEKAIESVERRSKIKGVIDNPIKKMDVFFSFGAHYFSIRNHTQSIQCYTTAAQIAHDLKDAPSEVKIYTLIGANHCVLNKYNLAIDSLNKALNIAIGLSNSENLLIDIYAQISSAYSRLGEYQKAIECGEKALEIQIKQGQIVTQESTCNFLATSYRYLGQYEKAITYSKQGLELGSQIELRGDRSEIINLQVKAQNLIGLGTTFSTLKNYEEAIKSFKEALEIVEKLRDEQAKGIILNNISESYVGKGDFQNAKTYSEQALEIAKTYSDLSAQIRAHSTLGKVCYHLKNYEESIVHHKKTLEIAEKIEEKREEGVAYFHLGISYSGKEDFQNAELNLIKSINLFSNLQQKLEEKEWQITIFEEQFKSYINLENVLIEQDNFEKSLEITDSRRSRALITTLIKGSSKIPSKNIQEVPKTLSVNEIKLLSKKQNTTFIVYSLNPLINNEKKLIAWIISPKGKIQHEFLPLESSLGIEGFSRGMVDMKDSFKEFPFSGEGRGKDSKSFTSKEAPILQEINQIVYRNGEFDSDSEDEGASTEKKIETSLKKAQKKSEFDSDSDLETNIAATEHPRKTSQFDEKNQEEQEILLKNARIALKKKLKAWYQALISPIEKHLPKSDSTQAITIIPDGFLSQIPFAILCYEDEQEQEKKDKYLIENYSISIAPSIKTLDLLSKIPKQFLKKPLIVGNPDTGNPKDDLPFAELEAKELKNVFGIDSNQVFTRKEASVSRVKEEMEKAQWIFLTCHGQAGKKPEDDPHSVFEGRFKLAPDEKHPKGFLHSEEISKTKLSAELVVLSACFSGTGKVMQEGSIGHVWSFLAAGAQSVLATYWPLQDSALTVEMVKGFTQSILGHQGEKLNKAQALRKVMVDAIKKDREKSIENKVEHVDKPDQWGAFYLSGLI